MALCEGGGACGGRGWLGGLGESRIVVVAGFLACDLAAVVAQRVGRIVVHAHAITAPIVIF